MCLSLDTLSLCQISLHHVSQQLSIVISVIYWSLLLFMPQFILQSFHEEPPLSSTPSPDLFGIPLSLDLALHACPALFLLLDFFLFEKKYSKKDVSVSGPTAIVCFSIWYSLWVEYCGKKNSTCGSNVVAFHCAGV